MNENQLPPVERSTASRSDQLRGEQRRRRSILSHKSPIARKAKRRSGFEKVVANFARVQEERNSRIGPTAILRARPVITRSSLRQEGAPPSEMWTQDRIHVKTMFGQARLFLRTRIEKNSKSIPRQVEAARSAIRAELDASAYRHIGIGVRYGSHQAQSEKTQVR
jgi:hypothetical protein